MPLVLATGSPGASETQPSPCLGNDDSEACPARHRQPRGERDPAQPVSGKRRQRGLRDNALPDGALTRGRENETVRDAPHSSLRGTKRAPAARLLLSEPGRGPSIHGRVWRGSH
ncbi:hypothetical protein CRUP_031260 [Coryphaenoides rupestris]|nr:hypothetical protein CRUP_031260 [Coryphaenoides rupestris]